MWCLRIVISPLPVTTEKQALQSISGREPIFITVAVLTLTRKLHISLQHPHGKVSTSQFANRQAKASPSKPQKPLWYLMCTMGSFNLVQLFESVFESPWLKVNHTIMAFQ